MAQNLSQWSIYRLRWPDDTKLTRPALLVSRADLIQRDVLYFLRISTSRPSQPWHVPILASEPWFRYTGLDGDSFCDMKDCKLIEGTAIDWKVPPGRLLKPMQAVVMQALKDHCNNVFALAGKANPPSIPPPPS